MQNLGVMLSVAYDLLCQKFDLWGYSISAANILAFDVIVGCLAWFVWEVLLGDD